MEQIWNLTQHKPTHEQVIAGVVEFPAEEREKIMNALTFEELPTLGDIHEQVMVLVGICRKYVKPYGKVMIGGAPFLMSHLQSELISSGMFPVYAFSKRVVEEKTVDGVVKKESIFRHAGFVEVI